MSEYAANGFKAEIPTFPHGQGKPLRLAETQGGLLLITTPDLGEQVMLGSGHVEMLLFALAAYLRPIGGATRR